MLAVLLAGCSGGKKDAPPTPAFVIEPVITISGTTTIERGECIGFRIQTENFQLDDPRVFLGPWEAVPGVAPYEIAPSELYTLDLDTIQVGFPCFFTSLVLPRGTMSITIIDGDEALSGEAFEVVDTTRVDLGEAPASSDDATNADAGTLAVPHDFDLYLWKPGSASAFLATEVLVLDTANAAFKPYQFAATSTFSRTWSGHEVVLVEGGAENYVTQIADDTVAGGPGYDYRFTVKPLAAAIAIAASESCDPVAIETTAAVFSLNLALAANDFDPGGSASCADRHVPAPAQSGEGVLAGGPDRAVKLRVPTGARLSAAAQSATTDIALYLLTDDGTGGCVPPPACAAAADTFGASSTETLRWRNDGPEQAVWLVVDDHGGGDSVPGPVTVYISLQ